MSSSRSNDKTFPRVLLDETLARVAAFLLGVELLSLSHASSATLEAFSHDALWSSRVAPALLPAHHGGAALQTNKQRYLRACASFAFPGRAKIHAVGPEPALAFMRVCSTMRDAFGSWGQPFSFELWFSIAPDDSSSSVHVGGVLLGAQSMRIVRATEMVPSHCAQLVYVDAERNLFCSALQSAQHEAPVAHALEHSRWYHLALVYTGEDERVYLDGGLLKTVDGQVPLEWRRLYAAQVGTGFVAAESFAAAHRPTVTGWYAFHGVIDDLRVYRYALSAATIQRQSTRAPIAVDDSNDAAFDAFDAAVFSLKRDEQRVMKRVCCSRPHERWCQSLAVDASSSESLEHLLDLV